LIRDLRPLDRLRSIKTKLGVLVAASVLAATTLAVVSVYVGLRPLLTVAIAVAVAIGVT